MRLSAPVPARATRRTLTGPLLAFIALAVIAFAAQARQRVEPWQVISIAETRSAESGQLARAALVRIDRGPREGAIDLYLALGMTRRTDPPEWVRVAPDFSSDLSDPGVSAAPEGFRFRTHVSTGMGIIETERLYRLQGRDLLLTRIRTTRADVTGALVSRCQLDLDRGEVRSARHTADGTWHETAEDELDIAPVALVTFAPDDVPEDWIVPEDPNLSAALALCE